MTSVQVPVKTEVVRSKMVFSVPVRITIGNKVAEKLLEIPIEDFREVPTEVNPNSWIAFAEHRIREPGHYELGWADLCDIKGGWFHEVRVTNGLIAPLPTDDIGRPPTHWRRIKCST